MVDRLVEGCVGLLSLAKHAQKEQDEIDEEITRLIVASLCRFGCFAFVQPQTDEPFADENCYLVRSRNDNDWTVQDIAMRRMARAQEAGRSSAMVVRYRDGVVYFGEKK